MTEFSADEPETGPIRARLAGRLDTSSVEAIELRVNASLCPPGKNVILDCSGVTHLSSMALRLLVGVARALHLREARLVIVSASPIVVESLSASGLDDWLPRVGSEAEALEILAT